MKRSSEIRKIAFIGDYLPRKCGIATFTSDLCSSVASQYPTAECFVVAVNDRAEGYEYPPEVRFEIPEQDLESYLRAADFLNFSNTDVVCLQHEYGIFGGQAGSHILALVRALRMPVVVTLHTVLRDPTPDQQRVLKQLAELSARLIVMSERGKSFLIKIYGIPEHKIDLIAHGIPDMPFVDPNFYKDQFGVEGKYVALTFGLISPNKGIEHALRAVPQVTREFPNFVYIVLGATHPVLVRDQGEKYRLSLERMAKDLGIKKHVIFYNRFVELNELKEFIGAADLYVTPYLNPAQITSGTLAYSFGCGKAVISTPYWHAEELLAEGRGILVPFGDPDAIGHEICGLLRDETRRHAMRKKAYLLGREMIWSYVAHLYMESFQHARGSRRDTPFKPLAMRTLEEQQSELPDLRLDHLWRMTDNTGMLQHACYTIPNFTEGYCTDDNARALLLAVLLEQLGFESPEVYRAAATYAAFVHAAFNPANRRFRNFMTFDRCWLEEVGSDDCHGRALWALGACVGRSKRRQFQSWAVQTFDQALPAIVETGSPRGWAFTLLGIHEYFRRLSGDRLVSQVRDTLTNRLIERYEQTATPEWPWFEDILSYDNAKLPHALILSGHASGNEKAQEIGLRSLRWLVDQQKAPQGHFRPIGSNGFYHKGQDRAQFDQQPLEAHATVSACLAACLATVNADWLKEARNAFDWFLGRNDLGQELYDASTGGCSDGLQEDRINQNQGAESTLAFLLALAELKLMESSLAAFPQITEMYQFSFSYLDRAASRNSGSPAKEQPTPVVAARVGD
jgi:glycosyltransferase involved in cell wall biosynthesis